MQINTEHPNYTKLKAARRMMRDCIAGGDAVKAQDIRKTYLPGFEDDPNDTRYDKYITRAIFAEYTGLAIDKTVGAIFRKESTVELPAAMEYLLEDATGCGQSLEQFAKQVTNEVNAVGVYGILTEYPQKNEAIDDQEKEQAFDLKARFKGYTSENIYNWRSKFVQGKEVLTQVRLIEYYENITSEFTSTDELRYRILDLFDPLTKLPGSGIYRQRIYDKSGGKLGEDIFPRNGKGQYWDRIPFVFVGAENNTTSVQPMPFYGLAVINLGHYRNSADYEEGLHIRMQGTLILNIGNMTGDQFKVQNGESIKIGARRAIIVGDGGGGELLQMESDGAGINAMEKKQEQMESFGLTLFQPGSAQKTAEEARIKASSESSVMSTVVGNISEGIEESIENACEFMGANPEEAEFSLNREFFPDSITAQDAAMLQALKDDGVISIIDLRSKLRKSGTIDPSRTDKEIDDDIKKELKDKPKDKEAINDNPRNQDTAGK